MRARRPLWVTTMPSNDGWAIPCASEKLQGSVGRSDTDRLHSARATAGSCADLEGRQKIKGALKHTQISLISLLIFFTTLTPRACVVSFLGTVLNFWRRACCPFQTTAVLSLQVSGSKAPTATRFSQWTDSKACGPNQQFGSRLASCYLPAMCQVSSGQIEMVRHRTDLS